MAGMITQRWMGRRSRRMLGLGVIFCLVAAACSGGGNDESSASTKAESTTNSPAVVISTTEPSEWREIGDGLFVDSDAPEGLTASVDASATVPPFGFAVFGEAFRVDASEQPDGEVTIRIPVQLPLPDGQIPVVVVADSAVGPWEPLLTEPTVIDGYVQAATPHFSFFQTLLVPVQDLLDSAREIFDDATGSFLAEAEQPACGGEDEFRVSRDITSTGSDTLKWCAGVEDGMPMLRVVNNRRYPLIASMGGFVVLDNPVDATAWSEIGRLLAADRLTLAPRSAATLLVDGDRSALATEFDGLAYSLFQLQVGVETAVAFLSKFGMSTTGSADLLLQSSKCLGTLTVPTGGNIIANCFELRDIVNAFGPKAAFIAPLLFVGPLIEFFHAAFNGLGDIISGRDRYNIDVSPRPMPPPAEIAPPELDTRRVFEVVSVDLTARRMIVREWFAPGPIPNPSPSQTEGNFLYVFGSQDDWSVGPEQTLGVSDGFTYERIDPYETSLDQFAAWANNDQEPSWTKTFWLGSRNDVIYEMALAWDISGDGECEEPRTLQPMNDNC